MTDEITSGASDFAVLGGGLAGLTFAYEAARRGRRVVVLEKEADVGGLAQTLVFGDYRFDLGGHRFHSPQAHLTAWVRDILDGEVVEVSRRSRICLNSRYVDYPLQFPSAITGFGLLQGAKVLASYLKAACWGGHGNDPSFEEWVVHRFGRALYDIYFRPYTEKIWGLSCHDLSADWASQRIRVPSLMAVMRGSLTHATVAPSAMVSRFIYPPLGSGRVCDALANKATNTGRVTILKNACVQGLSHDTASGWVIRHGDHEARVSASRVISTIPLPHLLNILPALEGHPPPQHNLVYRGVICVFLALDKSSISSDTWTYFPDQHLVFGRTHEPRNWSARMAPAGKTSLCLEVFCSEGDALWRRPDSEIVAQSVKDLEGLKIVKRGEVLTSWIARVPHAYPLYRVGYAESLKRVHSFLDRWPSLHVCGRTGTFTYLNMDKVIDEGLTLAGRLCPAP